jgi:hypothetical protein
LPVPTPLSSEVTSWSGSTQSAARQDPRLYRTSIGGTHTFVGSNNGPIMAGVTHGERQRLSRRLAIFLRLAATGAASLTSHSSASIVPVWAHLSTTGSIDSLCSSMHSRRNSASPATMPIPNPSWLSLRRCIHRRGGNRLPPPSNTPWLAPHQGLRQRPGSIPRTLHSPRRCSRPR